jgi:hypothetical protein
MSDERDEDQPKVVVHPNFDALDDEHRERAAHSFAIGESVLQLVAECLRGMPPECGNEVAINALINCLGATCLRNDDPIKTADGAAKALKTFVEINARRRGEKLQ